MYVSTVLVALALVLLMVSMITPVISTSTDFSIYNSGWNGTSKLAMSTYQLGKFAPSLTVQSTGSEISVVHLDLAEIPLDPGTDALVITGPTEEFSAAEGSLVGDFVRRGGVLLLADDFGTGNSLLEGMNATSRFSRTLLMDLAFDKKPEFSVCFTFTDDRLSENVTSILLNHPSSLTVQGTATETIASSSIASWLDTDANRAQDIGEPKGPFPVIARERLGQGSIILLSDPSVLINGMREHLDNAVLADNLLLEVGELRTAVYFDESHRTYFDPVSITTTLTGDLSLDSKIAILALAFVLLLWISTDIVDRIIAFVVSSLRSFATVITRFFFRKKPEPPPAPEPDLDRLVEDVVGIHPDWRKGLVRYILREQRRHSKYLDPEK
jgi:hypothetical protein